MWCMGLSSELLTHRNPPKKLALGKPRFLFEGRLNTGFSDGQYFLGVEEDTLHWVWQDRLKPLGYHWTLNAMRSAKRFLSRPGQTPTR
jgi:hypothetical protein